MHGNRNRIAVVLVLLASAVLAPTPTRAACGSPILLDTFGENLISNPDWCGGGGVGCYEFDSGPPVSPDIEGVFWALGTGDPVVGQGDDNGAFTGGLQSGDQWIKQVSQTFSGDLYHYPAFMTLKDGLFGYQSGNPVNWSLPVDGCVENAGPDPCTCLLFSDQWNDVGYFAFLGSKRSPNFDLSTGGDVIMAPIPRPLIVASMSIPGSEDFILQVVVPAEPAGNYVKDSCACEVGYLVYGHLVPLGGAPPSDRSAGWTLMTRGDGSPQTPTTAGDTTDILIDCDPARDDDLYLATALVGDSGFETSVVSANSSRVPCSRIYATPDRPDRGRQRDPQPGRGRDGVRRDRR